MSCKRSRPTFSSIIKLFRDQHPAIALLVTALLLSAAADYGSTLGLLAVWLLLQLYYGCKLCSAMQRRREVVGNETADEADQMRTPMTRVLTKNLQIDAKKDVQQAV